MNTPSIKKNFIMNALLTMSAFIFPLITFPYVSRILLPEGTGKVQFATSFVAYFNMIAQLGIPTYGIRACARVREDQAALTRTVHELLTINLGMCLVSYIALGFSIALIPRVNQDKILVLIISITILLNAVGMEWLYKALEQYTYITIRSVAFKAVSVAAMFILVHRQEDYLIYGAISIFAASASNILNLLNARKYISFCSIGDYNYWRHIKAVLIFFAMACATTVYTNLDEVMLGLMKTDADVGYYHAAVKIKGILVSIVTALGAVMLPRASYYIEHAQLKEFKRITHKALHFVLIIALPVMLYFIIFAQEGILFLSGKAFEPAVLPMQIIMPTVLLIGITNVLGIQILVPLGREKIVLYSEVSGAIVDLILNLVLIPKYAAVGAAIGTLCAEIVVFGVQYLTLRTEVKEALQEIRICTILTAAALACALTAWIKLLNLWCFWMLAVSATVFVIVYCACLLHLKEQMAMELWEQIKSRVRRTISGRY